MVQFIITHRFLHYRFLTYGFQVKHINIEKGNLSEINIFVGLAILFITPWGAEDARCKEPNVHCLSKNWWVGVIKTKQIFIPRLCNVHPPTFPASCDYWRWGSGGRQESINAICILALNIINDKVNQWQLCSDDFVLCCHLLRTEYKFICSQLSKQACEAKDLLWSLFEQCSLFMLISTDQINVQSLTILPRIIQIRGRRIFKYQNSGWTFFSQIKCRDLINERVQQYLDHKKWTSEIKALFIKLDWITDSICSWFILVFLCVVLLQDSPNDWSQLGISYLSPSEASMTWEINI